jgi:hypothetical protein
MLAKRGSRAGAKHPDGEPTTVLWLRHATDGSICWEQCQPPEGENEDETGAPIGAGSAPAAGGGGAAVPDVGLLPVGRGRAANFKGRIFGCNYGRLFARKTKINRAFHLRNRYCALAGFFRITRYDDRHIR